MVDHLPSLGEKKVQMGHLVFSDKWPKTEVFNDLKIRS